MESSLWDCILCLWERDLQGTITEKREEERLAYVVDYNKPKMFSGFA